MARFSFQRLLDHHSFVQDMGDVIEIRCNWQDGSTKVHLPLPGKKNFDVGDEIEETDPRAVRHFRADPRFKEIA